MTVLTAFDQYRAELLSLHVDASEQEVIFKARAGDQQAQLQLIALALPRVMSLAYRYKVYLPHDGLEDIISIGNLAMVECLQKALSKQSPIGFLIGCARIAIVDHVSRYSSLIAKQHYDKPEPVLWLDDALKKPAAANPKRLSEAEEALLYQAVESLSPIQREVIIAQYRLYGHTDDNLYKLHRRTGKKPGHYNKMIPRALKQMRRYLCEKGASNEQPPN